MNIDNLQHHLENKRVYSNDLNIILARTPSRIFRIILLTLLFAFLIVIVFSYFVKYSDTLNTKAVLTRNNSLPILYFIADEAAFGKIGKINHGIVTVPAGGQPVNKDIQFDSITTKKIYQSGDTVYNDVAAVERSIHPFNSLKVEYAVTCFINVPSSLSLPQTSEQVVPVTFLLNKRRLISKYLKY